VLHICGGNSLWEDRGPPNRCGGTPRSVCNSLKLMREIRVDRGGGASTEFGVFCGIAFAEICLCPSDDRVFKVWRAVVARPAASMVLLL
jgi:hypothetical protein